MCRIIIRIHLKRLLTAALAGLVLAALLTASFSAFADTCGEIRGDTLRLHVVANSNSAADQSLKLDVRDAVLRRTGEMFAAAGTKAQALATANSAILPIREAARDEIRAEGYTYPVTVSVVKMWFPTTRYERPEGTVTLPAGEYDAVRIVIGSGQGHNWFCVLFPQLCLPAAEPENPQELYSDSEQRVMKSGYEVKFAVLEWLESEKAGTEKEKSEASSAAAAESEAASSGVNSGQKKTSAEDEASKSGSQSAAQSVSQNKKADASTPKKETASVAASSSTDR